MFSLVRLLVGNWSSSEISGNTTFGPTLRDVRRDVNPVPDGNRFFYTLWGARYRQWEFGTRGFGGFRTVVGVFIVGLVGDRWGFGGTLVACGRWCSFEKFAWGFVLWSWERSFFKRKRNFPKIFIFLKRAPVYYLFVRFLKGYYLLVHDDDRRLHDVSKDNLLNFNWFLNNNKIEIYEKVFGNKLFL